MTTCRVIWKFRLPMTDVVRLVDPKPLAVQYDADGVGAAWVEHTVDCDTGQPTDGGMMCTVVHVATGQPTMETDDRTYMGLLVNGPHVWHFYLVTVPVPAEV